ncbi:hypothetical protein CANARDRAFT_175659 [[Candida] arabinofermentans NRRL YB-2248]|uniref:KOW domain-containing protein n=1 Tax=[Candida] arabinofermentans NRRL YB-2248 TaxID=983967 RepID=A0A1E4T2I1_9ASCO|nr:hypothetical protein CANARDRAFT_175659 [[Candida] arabinofermentans NRRL YB-2248]
MSSLRDLSKRYGANVDRFPHYLRKMFEQMSKKSQLPALRPDARIVEESKRFTKPSQWKVQVGDRVLITRGKLSGTVTKVAALHEASNRIYLEQSETRRIIAPQAFWQPNQDSHVLEYPKTYHINDVKVVGTIVEEDGTERDIAADKLVFKGAYFDQDYNKMMPIRRIKYNEHIVIPWPKPEPVEDCEFSTPREVTEVRTHYTDSIVKLDTPEGYSVETFRNPTAKNWSKWNKRYLSKSDIKKLTPPEMPLSETKKAMLADKLKIKEQQITEMSPEVLEFIGGKVAQHLNSITDPNFKQFVDANDPARFIAKKAKKAEEKKALIENNKENYKLNEIRKRVEQKHKSKSVKKHGNKIW